MKCQKCGAENEQGTTFCTNCGNRLHDQLVKFCPSCGGINSPDAAFCRNCGQEFIDENNPPKTLDTIWDYPKEEATEHREAVYEEAYEPFEEEAGYEQTPPYADAVQQPYVSESYGYEDAPAKKKTKQKAKKKRSVMPVVWVIEIALCALLAFFAYRQGNETYSAEQQARNFYANIASGRYDTAFAQTDLKETDFVNADTFAAYWAQTDFTSGAVFDSTIAQQTAGKATIDITYGDKQLSLPMQVDGRKLLVFKNWVVDGDSMLVGDIAIRVPVGATLSIDGTEVSTSYISQSDVSISDDVSVDIYLIDSMMAGIHTIGVNAGTSGTYELVVEPGSQETIEALQVSESAQKDVTGWQQTAVNNMKAILTAASTDAEFDTISSLFTAEEETLAAISADYAALRSYFGQAEAPVAVRISSITTTANPDDNSVTINLNYDYDYYTAGSQDMKTKGGTTSYTMTFSDEDGVWYQTNLGVTSFI